MENEQALHWSFFLISSIMLSVMAMFSSEAAIRPALGRVARSLVSAFYTVAPMGLLIFSLYLVSCRLPS